MLLDDARRLAVRASSAEVDVVLDITAKVPHVFQSFTGVLDEAGEALDRAALFLRQRVRGPAGPMIMPSLNASPLPVQPVAAPGGGNSRHETDASTRERLLAGSIRAESCTEVIAVMRHDRRIPPGRMT
jgi:hypothetical protein